MPRTREVARFVCEHGCELRNRDTSGYKSLTKSIKRVCRIDADRNCPRDERIEPGHDLELEALFDNVQAAISRPDSDTGPDSAR